MNCEQVKGHLSAYLDNALPFEERRYVAIHVEQCVDCQHILADFTHFDALLAQLPRVSPGPDLRERLFSSQEYLGLIGTASGIRSRSLPESVAHLVPYSPPRRVSLPGDRQVHERNASFLAKTVVYTPPAPCKNKRRPGRRWLLYGIAALCILLTFGIGALIRWQPWRWRERGPSATITCSPLTIPPHDQLHLSMARSPFSHDFLAISQKTPNLFPLFHRGSV